MRLKMKEKFLLSAAILMLTASCESAKNEPMAPSSTEEDSTQDQRRPQKYSREEMKGIKPVAEDEEDSEDAESEGDDLYSTLEISSEAEESQVALTQEVEAAEVVLEQKEEKEI